MNPIKPKLVSPNVPQDDFAKEARQMVEDLRVLVRKLDQKHPRKSQIVPDN